MFSYVDKRIRVWLEERGLLCNLDVDGRVVEPDSDRRPYLSLLGPVPMPRKFGEDEVVLHWYTFVRRVELGRVLDAAGEVQAGNHDSLRSLLQTHMAVNSVLAFPGFLEHPNPLVRLHSSCMTGDVFGSLRCDCGPQLDTAMNQILEDGGGGAVIYLSGHEGRGIGLWAKAITYLLQDAGQDTYQANVSLGLPEDSRDFTEAAVVLRYLLEGRPIRLLSNNPLKKEHLEKGGQAVSEMVPLVAGVCHHNLRYLKSKRDKGHMFPELP